MVMRLATSIVLVARSMADWPSRLTISSAALPALQCGLAMLLLAGLWTPVAALIVALIEAAFLVAQTDDPWMHLLTGTLGLALALLGPGTWSVDARLFGWRRIDLRDRQSRPHAFKG